MRIGIIGGTGKEGRGLAARWAAAGHKVTIGSRSAERAAARAAELSERYGHKIAGGANDKVAAWCEVVVLTVPYAAQGPTLDGLKAIVGDRPVIDLTVPLKPPKVREVHLPAGQSAALEARAILGPDARLVAALHHVSSAHLAEPDHTIDCDVLVCSDHGAACELAIQLIGDLGLRAFDAGPLQNAVALESLTPVLLHLNKRYKIPGAGLRITGLE